MKHIFISKKIDDHLMKKAQEWNYSLHPHEMLDIKYHISDELKETISKLYDQQIHIVITSQNAIHSLRTHFSHLQPPPHWIIYTINQATLHSIVDWYGHDKNIVADAQDIKELIQYIPHNHRLYHLAGEITRPDLYIHCQNNQIDIEKWAVYSSNKNEIKLNRSFDAYFLCSPRSVEALLKYNTIHSDVPMVSIGSSTSESLSIHKFQNIIQSEHPTLMDMLTTYYNYDQK